VFHQNFPAIFFKYSAKKLFSISPKKNYCERSASIQIINMIVLFLFLFTFAIGTATAFVIGRLPGLIDENRWMLVSIPRSEDVSLYARDNQPTESFPSEDRVWRPKSPTQADIRGAYSPSSSSSSSSSRSVEQEWKSGEVFKNNNQQNRRRRNDPWWMREEEKTNPRVLPPYKPWWALPEENAPISVTETMKVAELKEECEKLGVSSKGKKDELLQLLRETKALYDLSDANFRQPTFVQCGTQRPSCYPEVYEEVGAAGELSSKAFSSFKAPPQAGDSSN